MKSIEFRFSGTRISLDVPADLFATVKDKSQYLAKILEQPARQRVVDTEMLDDGIRLSLDTKRAGNINDLSLKEDRCRQMLTAVCEISEQASDDQQDPTMKVRIGTNRINNGDRYGMDARVTWPATQPETLQEAATKAMRVTAEELKFVPKSLIPDIYAIVDRKKGITLETFPVASSSLDTDGNTYDPSEPIVELYGHNIYNHQMQLICLSGLVAIAHT